MRASHTKKIILALLLFSHVSPTHAVIEDFDVPDDILDIGYLDIARAVTAPAVAGAKFVHSAFNTVREPYNVARKYFTDVAEGAKVGSLRVSSKNHWISTAIEPLSQIHGLGWLKHVSFAARRGPDMLHLFINEKLTVKQKAIALALGIVEPIASTTGISALQNASSSLRGKLGVDAKDVAAKSKLSWVQKLIIMGLHLTKYRKFSGDAAGLQYSIEQILESFIHYGVYSYRGDTNTFHNDNWTLLKASPKFQRAANRLFYSLFTEVAIVQGINYGVQKKVLGDNLLGRYGIDAALFAKDLLMPLLIYRARFHKHMPDMASFASTNALRTALKIYLTRAPIERIFGHRDVTDPVFVALRACENEGLFDRRIAFWQGHISEQFDNIFNLGLSVVDIMLSKAGLNVNFGHNSMNAKEVMRHSRDLLYNVPGAYPAEFMQSLQGTAMIMDHNEKLSTLDTPGLFAFDHEMEVKRGAPATPVADMSAVEEILRGAEHERAKLERGVHRERALLEGDAGSLLRGLLGRR